MLDTLLDPSSYTHSAFALPIGVVALLSLCVGAWVVWHENGRQVSRSLFASTLAVAVYLFGFTMMVQAANAEVALFWGKVAYLGVPFIVPAIFHFSMDLLGLRQRRKRIIRIAWLLGIVYAELAVGTDILVEGVFRMEWGYITRLSPWNLLVLVWSTALVALAISDYIREYRVASPIQQARIRLFAVPIAVGSLGFIDYLPSLGMPLQPWGFLVFVFFLATAAWAVSRYHLPDLTPAFAADQILSTMVEPLLVCDEHGVVAFANRAAVDKLGWPHEDLVDQPLHAILGAGPARTVLRKEGKSPEEFWITGRDGEPIAVSVTTNSVQGRRGQRVGTVVVARDIREQLRAAEEIERREQRFRALIEQSRETITILDGEGRVTFDSASIREILGYEVDEWVGRPVVERVHPEDKDRVQALFARLLHTPRERLDSECRVENADGEYRIFEFGAINLLADPAVCGVVVNGRDVTEKRALAAQLQQAQKMEAIGRLAGGVAHDFNNILTAVQGNVALIQEEDGHEGPHAGELDEIRRGAERAARLTNQLLAFSRRQVLRPVDLELEEVVAEMRDMLRRLIGENIVLDMRIEPEVGTIRADRGQLEQVILNLIVNARDAIDGTGRIEIGVGNIDVDDERAGSTDFKIEPGPYVLLRVTDDGKGMDDGTLERLFEPFFTTKEPGKGTGLGLSTVYGSVRQASGAVSVESRVGDGTTFSVYLPRVADADGSAGRPAPSSDPAQPPADGQGEVVLVVEDEAPVRSLIARVLTRRGYQVLEAGDGETALEMADEHGSEIHLLVADLVMPGISGREVADQLAARHPDMAIILISGYTADEVVRKGIVAGEREFLPKPFTPDVLVEKVKGVLRRSRAA